MKKCVLSLLLASLLILPVSGKNCSAAAWVLYHPKSGTILAGENADTPLPMAGTTKIMTALLVLENCDLQEIVSVPEECTGIEGSSLYLKAGERYTVNCCGSARASSAERPAIPELPAAAWSSSVPGKGWSSSA